MKENNSLIFTFSGIRGISGKDLNFDVAKRIAIAFGLWFTNNNRNVILGRDTRPSGEIIERGIIEGLITTGFNIINVGICPTPIIIYSMNKLHIPAGIIITGSHNPQEWNGLKLLSERNYLNTINLQKIFQTFQKISVNSYPSTSADSKKQIKVLKPIPDYIQSLYNNINYKKIRKNNRLKVVVDSGAGAAKFATPQILRGLGCYVKVINNDMFVNQTFPREIEPIEKNLKDLMMEVWQGKFDVGFAHDSDADRLTIIGENSVCYPEDVGLALITDYYLKKNEKRREEIIFVTNLASSLIFEELAKKHNAQLIRTPVGERFLIEKMDDLIKKGKKNSKHYLIFGGEGSCGGVMFPSFNNTRDGIFAAAKIIEILVNTGEKISHLVSKLPKYYSSRQKINITNQNKNLIISQTKKELMDEGENVNQFDLDLRFGHKNEWFVLIHPSNTEPIIRVISEAKSSSLARIYCEATAELVRLVISKL